MFFSENNQYTTIDVIDHNSEDTDISSDFDHLDISEELEDEEDNLTYGNVADSDEEFINALDDDDEHNVSYADENDNPDDNEENDDYQSIDLQDIRASIRRLIDRMLAFINNINSIRAVTDCVQQQKNP